MAEENKRLQLTATKQTLKDLKLNDGVMTDSALTGGFEISAYDIEGTGTAIGEFKLGDQSVVFRAPAGGISEVPVASNDTVGGFKTGYPSSGNNYKVQLDSNNRAYVTVDDVYLVSGRYDDTSKKLLLTLNDSTKSVISVDVTDMIKQYTADNDTLTCDGTGTQFSINKAILTADYEEVSLGYLFNAIQDKVCKKVTPSAS